ncbi:OLC1v1027670C1 [Oldenlandia corymbosa var. corymbosa]|uniref:OLC1v1027670C1 n=1 Tax=Oldenlandia corymbosa var. corymbosa TaxID=529605 RepID=A0AAV1CA11_OLDCO|nr:OLC1v1027670C1 [Oldenlandia corymbosa var. corymbosa]
MGDSLSGPNSNMLPEVRVSCRKKQSITYLAASASKVLSQKTVQSITSAKQHLQGSGVVGDLVLFLAMTAALEVVRRFSKAKCPFVWRALQTLQAIHFPPFKWFQRWLPFKGLAKSTEKLSRPMLVLSIATLFSDEAGYSPGNSDGATHSQDSSSPGAGSSSQTSRPEIGASTSENWLLQLDEELKKQGIERPERLGRDELLRFYAAVHGDFQKLIAAVKKTINWRQSYELLRPQELRAWSHLIFWHGHDTRQRPCLILRLGLACSTLQSSDMPLLVKAVVSQIEHGVLNLVKVEQPQIMVLMDCLGLSPLGFPINMMRSCATLLQDHYPNRLGSLMIVRLPHLARVVTQTLFQVNPNLLLLEENNCSCGGVDNATMICFPLLSEN